MHRIATLARLHRSFLAIAFVLLVATVPTAWASESGESSTHGGIETLLWFAIILIAAKIGGHLVERWGQPAVLGELIVGVLIGNLALINLDILEPMKTDPGLALLAELGVIILLFQIGLESNVKKMLSVGVPALLVATIGVVAPFVLGTWVVGPWVMPGLDTNAYLFLGAALTATSVGITARVFKDLGKDQTREAQIVLGAAVIDDVMGLVVLAVVSAIVEVGSVSLGGVSLIVGKSILFLLGAIVIGQFIARYLGAWLSKIHTGAGMKLAFALSFGFVVSYLAGAIELAPIVGAFAAGLVLDPVHFKSFKGPEPIEELTAAVSAAEPTTSAGVHEVLKKMEHSHVEDLIKPLAFVFVPVFFVYTGLSVNLKTFADLQILGVALAITVVAFAGKIVAGVAAGRGTNKTIVGFGMIPRGEVGLIFVTTGKALGVVDDAMYSVVVIMIILTTLLTPPILTFLLKRQKSVSPAPQEFATVSH